MKAGLAAARANLFVSLNTAGALSVSLNLMVPDPTVSSSAQTWIRKILREAYGGRVISCTQNFTTLRPKSLIMPIERAL